MNCLKALGLGCLFILIMIGGFVVLTIVPQIIYSVDYIFYSIDAKAYFLLMLGLLILASYVIASIKRHSKGAFQFNEDSDIEMIGKVMSKNWHRAKYIVPVVLIICCYLACTQVVFVTSNQLFVVNPFHPFGTYYNFGEVVEVSIDSPFYKSDLDYIVIFNDGTKVNLNGGGGDDIHADTYESLQNFDREIIKLGAKKSSNLDAVYKCTKDYDRIYHERWMNIAQNGLIE